MPTTPLGIRYPAGLQPPAGPLQFQQLAEDVDELVQGLKDLNTDWESWTPTLGADTVAPNIGSTGTRLGHYKVTDDKLVVCQFAITFGGSGITAGTGYYYINPPVPAATVPGTNLPAGDVLIRNNNLHTRCFSRMLDRSGVRVISPLYVSAAVNGGLAAVANNAPSTSWIAGDFLQGTIIYRAA